MDVSILICTWNSCANLRITLDSFKQLRIPEGLRWEVVVVNNNCTDDTEDVVADYQAVLPIRQIKESRQGLSFARNRGLTECQGRLIIFADDDIKPAVDWLQAYWQAFSSRPEGFYFGGPVESEFVAGRPVPELVKLAPFSVRGLHWGDEMRMLTESEMFIGPNWACPAEALRQVGGFDTAMGLNPALKKVRTGEEKDLMLRLNQAGWLPWYLPQARIRHLVPAKKVQFKHIMDRREAFGYESAAERLAEYNGPMVLGLPRWIYKQIIFSYLKYWKSRVSGKPGYQEYAHYRFLKGLIDGIRELPREKKDLLKK